MFMDGIQLISLGFFVLLAGIGISRKLKKSFKGFYDQNGCKLNLSIIILSCPMMLSGIMGVIRSKSSEARSFLDGSSGNDLALPVWQMFMFILSIILPLCS